LASETFALQLGKPLSSLMMPFSSRRSGLADEFPSEASRCHASLCTADLHTSDAVSAACLAELVSAIGPLPPAAGED
jgi:hypothetical protein